MIKKFIIMCSHDGARLRQLKFRRFLILSAFYADCFAGLGYQIFRLGYVIIHSPEEPLLSSI